MEIIIDNSEVTEALNRMVQICENELPWQSIGIDAELSIDQNFDAGGRYQSPDNPIGGDKKWVPRKVDQPWPILQKSLALRQSIYSEADTESATVGSKGLPYNRAQHYGYSPRNLPARPFLTIHPDDLEKIMEQITQSIVEAFD